MKLRLRLIIIGAALATLASAQFYGYKDQPVPGQSRVATTSANAGVRIEQKLGDFIPLDAAFTDHKGKAVQLRDYFGKRPVMLLMLFYSCPGVCTDELTNIVKLARDFKRDDVGETFDVVVVSIDPSETPRIAAAKHDGSVDFYNRKGTDAGWHFLVGDKVNIDKLADAVGFKYSRDPLSKNLVHPAGMTVLSATGRISRYFITTEYPTQVVINAIREASKEKVGVKDDRPFYLACIHIDPLTGQRSLNVINALKVTGLLTCCILFGSIAVMTLRARKVAKPTLGGLP